MIPKKLKKANNMYNVIHDVTKNMGVKKIIKKDPINHEPFKRDYSNFRHIINDNYDDLIKEARQHAKLASSQKAIIPEKNTQYIDLHKNILNFNGNNNYSEQAKKLLDDYKNNRTRKRKGILEGNLNDNFIMQNNEFVDYNMEVKGARHIKKNVNFISVDKNENYIGVRDTYQNIDITMKSKKPQINIDNAKPQKEYNMEPENEIKISHIIKDKKSKPNDINRDEKNFDIIANTFAVNNIVKLKPKKPAIIIDTTNIIFDENTYNIDNKANVNGLFNKTKKNKNIIISDSLKNNEKIFSDVYLDEKIDITTKLHPRKNINVNPQVEKVYEMEMDNKPTQHITKKVHKIPIDYQPKMEHIYDGHIQSDVLTSLNETKSKRVMKSFGSNGVPDYNDNLYTPQNNSVELKQVQKKNKFTTDETKIYTDIILTDTPELNQKIKKRNLSVKNDDIIIDTNMLNNIEKLDKQFEDKIKKNVQFKNRYNEIYDGQSKDISEYI